MELLHHGKSHISAGKSKNWRFRAGKIHEIRDFLAPPFFIFSYPPTKQPRIAQQCDLWRSHTLFFWVVQNIGKSQQFGDANDMNLCFLLGFMYDVCIFIWLVSTTPELYESVWMSVGFFPICGKNHVMFQATNRSCIIWYRRNVCALKYPPVIKHSWLENPRTEWRFLTRKNHLFPWSIFQLAVFDYQRVDSHARSQWPLKNWMQPSQSSRLASSTSGSVSLSNIWTKVSILKSFGLCRMASNDPWLPQWNSSCLKLQLWNISCYE